MSEEERRYLGRSVERKVREYLEEVCGEECRDLALKMLDAYTYGGQRGLAELLERVVEGEDGDTD